MAGGGPSLSGRPVQGPVGAPTDLAEAGASGTVWGAAAPGWMLMGLHSGSVCREMNFPKHSGLFRPPEGHVGQVIVTHQVNWGHLCSSHSWLPQEGPLCSNRSLLLTTSTTLAPEHTPSSAALGMQTPGAPPESYLAGSGQPYVPAFKRPSRWLPQRESEDVTSTPHVCYGGCPGLGPWHRSRVRHPERLGQAQMARF